MSQRKLLETFDNDYLFMENLRIAKKENFTNLPKNDITFSKVALTKTHWETEPFQEEFDTSAHLKFQHINDFKPLTSQQRLYGKILSNNAYKTSLNEIYN